LIEHLARIPKAISEISTSLTVAAFAGVTFLLFAPDPLASQLGLEGVRNEYRSIFGVSVLLLGCLALSRFIDVGASWLRNNRKRRQSQIYLHTLTPEEKGYLRVFIEERKNSVSVGLEDGVMAGLCRKGITYQASSVGSALDGFDYNLQPWAREYLEQRTELLADWEGVPKTPGQKIWGG